MTTKLLAFNSNQSHYEPLICDTQGRLVINLNGANFNESGELLVSGGTSSGSGGDSTASNQLLQITEAQTTNTKLTSIDTKLIKCNTDSISGSVSVSNQITGFSVASKQDTQITEAQTTNTKLTSLDSKLTKCNTDSISGSVSVSNQITGFSLASKQDTQITSLQSIDDKLGTLKTYEAKYNIESAVLLQSPGQNPSYSAPPSNLGIPKTEGYYWKNTVAGQASQLYFYSYLNLSGTPAGQTKPFQLQEITNSYAVIRVGNVNFGSSIPFLGIYTRPTGTGDAVPGFYKSRRVYTLPAQSLTQSMKVMIWWGISPPDVKLWPGVARVQASLASSNGTQAPTELVAFMSLNTDSAASQNQVEYVLNGAGFQVGTDTYSSVFSGQSSMDSITGDASASNQTTQITEAQTTNTKLTSLDTKIIKCDTDNISGSVSVSNQLTGFSTSAKQDTQITEAQTTNTKLTSLDTKIIKCDTDNISGSVSVSNQLTGFSTSAKQDTQITEAQTTNTKLTSLDTKIIKCDTDNIAGSVSVDNFPEYALDSTLLLVKAQTDKLTFAGTALEVEVQNSVGITSASPLDVHCFGSSDGVVFHHLKTNPNGVLATNAIMETDANGALTSTENGTINSLDVHLQNTATSPANCLSYGKDADTNLNVPLKVDEDGVQIVSIQSSVQVLNATGSELSVKAKQFGSYGNLCNNQTFTPGQASTALNISEFITMAGFYTDTYGGAAPTGALRLQYSFDGTTWYNIYNTQVFPSGTGTRTATIFNQAVFGLNFVRFLNDTNQTHPSVTITILGSTLQ